MPHATQAYPFELKVVNFAFILASRLRAETESGSFLMLFDKTGSIESMQFDSPAKPLMPETEKLEAAGTAYFFYDAFEPDEYTWLAWHNVNRSSMERMMATSFIEEDFIPIEGMNSRAKPLSPEKVYPQTWSVMFG